MDEQFVTDCVAIISLRNLRVVTKSDGNAYHICCTYSDMPELDIRYEDKELRDNMFMRLAKRLDTTQVGTDVTGFN